MTSLLGAPRRFGSLRAGLRHAVGLALGAVIFASPTLARACLLDLECPATAWCRIDGALSTCTPKTANGQLVPGGECDGDLAARACASGVCDYVSSLCGVPIGDDCTRDAECTGGVCVDEPPAPADGGAGDAGGDGAAPALAGVCRECRAVADCANKGPLRVCDPTDGRCAVCATDADCAGETPVCDRTVRACVAERPSADGGARDAGDTPRDGGGVTPDGDAGADGGSAAEIGLSVEGGGCGCVVPGTAPGASASRLAAGAALALVLGGARRRRRVPSRRMRTSPRP